MGPLLPPFSFSGNFGELRPSHFHSGLDFRTQGRTGLPVFAVKDGYVSRIVVSATGYGNALYMDHPDGTTSVYGHLEKFHPKLHDYIKEKQYGQERFQISLTLTTDEFYFKKGDIIAWTGNSGSSGGPHLHFEIRGTKSERVYNPIFYGIGIKDNSVPKIYAVYVYPLNENSSVGQGHIKKRFETVPVHGGYQLKNNLPIELFGKIGFGVQAEDDFNGTGLKCGVYSVALFCDGAQVFGFKMESFSLSESRYANAHADYEESLKSHKWVQRLYKLPGNHLDIYSPADNDGTINFEPGKGHEIEIIVCDASKNKTRIRFKATIKKAQLPTNRTSAIKRFLYDQPNEYENNQIRVEIPQGALYDDLDFEYKSKPKIPGCYAPLHTVCSKYVPLHLPYSLSIKCDNEIPENLKEKTLIVLVDPNNGHKTAIGGEYSRGWVSVKTDLFGTFSIATDTTAPVIVPLSIKDKKLLSDSKKVQFTITDNLSGIKSYRGEIDGKWVLFEYDTKSKLITYTFDKNRIAIGKSHLLRLTVTDKRENSNEYKAIIYK